MLQKTRQSSMNRPVGRPRKISTPEEFEAKMEAYVQHCREENVSLTMAGMTLALGFAHRSSIHDYARKPEFTDMVKKAQLYVEHSYELLLHGPNPAGAIFVLRKFGWSDKPSRVRAGQNTLTLQAILDDLNIRSGDHAE